MALGNRRQEKQTSLWMETQKLVQTAGHPFYQKLNEVFQKYNFDKFAETTCAKFYAGKKGRPGIPPGIYFRMLLLGYFEGIDGESRICFHWSSDWWRAGHS